MGKHLKSDNLARNNINQNNELNLLEKALSDGIIQVSVAAVIVKDQCLFMLHRNPTTVVAPGKWHIPGGKVESQEDLHDGLVREIMEETGLEISIVGYADKYFDFVTDKGKNRTYFYYCTAAGEISLNPENSEYAYVPSEQIPKYRKDEQQGLYKHLLEQHPNYSTK